MAKPVEIGTRSFRTQKSALDHYKALLHRYEPPRLSRRLLTLRGWSHEQSKQVFP